jgi:hypothetical protein
MGEIRDEDDDHGVGDWLGLIASTEHDPRLRSVAERLREAGPPPVPGQVTHSFVILDTDIGRDVDDAIAVAAAAATVPELALVITCDEYGGQRARFARHLLDLLGRRDVPVVAGADLGNSRFFCVDGLISEHVPDQPSDLEEAVETVSAAASLPVRWVGMDPMSNLARLADTRPDLLARMEVTQMGGALRYRDPTRAEHNFRLDPDAARHAMAAVPAPSWSSRTPRSPPSWPSTRPHRSTPRSALPTPQPGPGCCTPTSIAGSSVSTRPPSNTTR